jgi:hypothetical protein
VNLWRFFFFPLAAVLGVLAWLGKISIVTVDHLVFGTMRQLSAHGGIVLLLRLVLLDCAFAGISVVFFGVHNCALRWPLLARSGLLLVR